MPNRIIGGPGVRSATLAEALTLADQQYPLDISALDAYFVNGTGGALALGDLVMLDQASTGVASTGEYTRVIAPTVAGNLATAGTYHLVAQQTIASGAVGRFRLYGDTMLNLNASSATIGTLLYTRGTNKDATNAVTAGGKIIGKTKIATTTGVVRVWFDGRGVAAVPTLVGLNETYVPARLMVPNTTNGSSAVTALELTGANDVMIVTLDFDKTTREYACFDWVPPKRWDNGTVTFIPYWSHAAEGVAATSTVVWSLAGKAVSNDDAMEAAFGTEQTSTDIGVTADDLFIGPASSAITIGGTPATADMIQFKVSRVVASDDLDVDARLHGVKILWTANATTDD